MGVGGEVQNFWDSGFSSWLRPPKFLTVAQGGVKCRPSSPGPGTWTGHQRAPRASLFGWGSLSQVASSPRYTRFTDCGLEKGQGEPETLYSQPQDLDRPREGSEGIPPQLGVIISGCLVTMLHAFY
jgi:hypothetical protein